MNTGDSKPYCLICKGRKMRKHHYAPNHFNGKLFYYYRCLRCNSLSVHPIPTEEDFKCMYGMHDHTYLQKMKEGETVEYHFDYPKFDHQKYQIDFFKQDISHIHGHDLLDYGCGSGFYMEYAESFGFQTAGIEHDESFADVLRKKSGKNIFTFKEFKDQYKGKKFSVIHFGHVLEHLSRPEWTIKRISEFAGPSTLWIFDGPLEYNACLTRWAVEAVSKIRKRRQNPHQPQHLSFTNHHAQKLFFEQLGFITRRYIIKEQDFPFPPAPNWKSMKETAEFILSRSSIYLSLLFPKMGNIFHYTGNLKK